MEAAFLLGKSGHEPWSETAISPEPSPSAKSLLGLHLSGAAFGYNCPGAVSPSWHEHYVSARPPGLQVLEVWNNSTLRELPNTQPSVQAKDKALLQPSLRWAHGTVISAKNTGAFPFTHAEVPATKVITESEEIFIFSYFLSTQMFEQRHSSRLNTRVFHFASLPSTSPVALIKPAFSPVSNLKVTVHPLTPANTTLEAEQQY